MLTQLSQNASILIRPCATIVGTGVKDLEAALSKERRITIEQMAGKVTSSRVYIK